MGSLVWSLPDVFPRARSGNPDTVKVAKVNVDEEPNLASQFGVMSIPTVVLIKDGQVITQSVGAMSKNQVEAMLR